MVHLKTMAAVTFNYLETVQWVSTQLTHIDSLKSFCIQNNLNYNVVCRFRKNYTEKQYPNALISTLLALECDFIKKETCFSFEIPVT